MKGQAIECRLYLENRTDLNLRLKQLPLSVNYSKTVM